MSVVDIPPGIGLEGAALGMFTAPRRARRLSTISLIGVAALGVATWALVSRHPYTRSASTQAVIPVALALTSAIGFAVRHARVAITRDGVNWGWAAFNFTQQASRIVTAHVFADGITLQAKRGSWWFLAARDWDRFDALVRQLRRAELPITEHQGKAPLRARLQSYGRFLDALLVLALIAAVVVMLWAA